jgi:hypothetical protein
MWSSHQDFLNIVRAVWNVKIHSCLIKNFKGKLSNLKKHLKGWNKHTFKDINKVFAKDLERVHLLEQEIRKDSLEECFKQLYSARNKYYESFAIKSFRSKMLVKLGLKMKTLKQSGERRRYKDNFRKIGLAYGGD